MKTLIKATEPTDQFCEEFGAAVQEMHAERTTVLMSRGGRVKAVRQHDPVWDLLEGKRARFSRMEFDGMVELTDNDGKILPDLRQPEQVLAY